MVTMCWTSPWSVCVHDAPCTTLVIMYSNVLLQVCWLCIIQWSWENAQRPLWWNIFHKRKERKQKKLWDLHKVANCLVVYICTKLYHMYLHIPDTRNLITLAYSLTVTSLSLKQRSFQLLMWAISRVQL